MIDEFIDRCTDRSYLWRFSVILVKGLQRGLNQGQLACGFFGSADRSDRSYVGFFHFKTDLKTLFFYCKFLFYIYMIFILY